MKLPKYFGEVYGLFMVSSSVENLKGIQYPRSISCKCKCTEDGLRLKEKEVGFGKGV